MLSRNTRHTVEASPATQTSTSAYAGRVLMLAGSENFRRGVEGMENWTASKCNKTQRLLCLHLCDTWLDNSVPDSAIPGLLAFRLNRDVAQSCKTRGIYINTERSRNVVLVSNYCSLLVEFVSDDGVYTSTQHQVLMLTMGQSSSMDSSVSSKAHIQMVYLLLQQILIKPTSGKYCQSLDFPTTGEDILDIMYTNIPGAYQAEPLPHQGHSDHISVLLIPAYQTLVKLTKPSQKETRTWLEETVSAFQDCFKCTDWDIFKQASLTNAQ